MSEKSTASLPLGQTRAVDKVNLHCSLSRRTVLCCTVPLKTLD